MKTLTAALVAVLALLAVLALGWRFGEKARSVRATPGPRLIRLASRTIDPAELAGASVRAAAALSPRGTCVHAVHCRRPVSAAVRARANEMGARVLAFIPDNALLVEASPKVIAEMLGTADFSAAVAYEPSDKMRRGLTGGRVTVVPLAESDRARLVAFVAANGGVPHPTGPSFRGSFRADVSDGLLMKLAARGDVRWLERAGRPRLMNEYATADTGVRQMWNAHGLTGRGQVIATADSGLDTGNVRTLHRDFANRIVGIVNLGGETLADYCGHGTHTAGILAGDGAMSGGLHRGVAHEATLFVQACGDTVGSDNIYFGNADTYADIFAAGLGHGSYIHSDSWGLDNDGEYDDFCAGLDDATWNAPELLVVAAAGNSGSGKGTINSPSSAKNALAVGSTNSSRGSRNPAVIVSSSSRGPCADGRIKPDVTAPGYYIVSTRSSVSGCSWFDGDECYTRMSGTSMAAPHAAGCAGLVRQWLVERRGFTNAIPTAALVKAVLTGGAIGSGPDHTFGWGRLALEETLFPSNREVRLIDRIPYSAGCALVYDVTLTNAAPFDAQLTWIDHPGDASAARMLVNDLDLTVSNKTTGAVWRGNGVAGGDRLNNVESVRIPVAASGEYAVIVSGAAVPYDCGEGGAAALYLRGAFPADDGAGDLVSLSVAVDGPRRIVGSPVPGVGVWRYPKGSPVALASGGFALATNANGTVVARHAYEGFAGTGAVPAGGSDAAVGVVLDRDSSVAWRFAAEPEAHALRFHTCHPEDDWYAFVNIDGSYGFSELTETRWVGTNAQLTVVLPDDLPRGDGYEFVPAGFEGEVSFEMKLGEVEVAEVDRTPSPCLDGHYALAKAINLTMDGAKDVWARYYDAADTVDGTLPLWWYRRYLHGPLSHGLITERATRANGDPDGDGFDNLAEYTDGTEPVNDESFRFLVDDFTPTSVDVTATIKGRLIVERCEWLDGEWTGVMTNLGPRQATRTRLSFPAASGGCVFLRVRNEP